MAFDRESGRIVFIGQPDDGRVETWTFDVCSNTWTRMHPDREPPQGTGPLVYDVESDLTIATGWSERTIGERVRAYDLEADTWTEKDIAQGEPRFYDPVSGLVVALGDDGDDDTLGLELWGYEVETDTWAPMEAEPLAIGPHYEDFAYDTSVDRLVAYAATWKGANGDWLFEPRTWLFDLRTGTWSGTGAATPEYSYGWWGIQPGIAYDEAAERTIMFGQGQSAAYDATADRWETLYVGTPRNDPGACGTRPECRSLPHLVYDPVNERLVVYGGFLGPEGVADDLLAFDTRTREWTVLLEASRAQPAP